MKKAKRSGYAAVAAAFLLNMLYLARESFSVEVFDTMVFILGVSMFSAIGFAGYWINKEA